MWTLYLDVILILMWLYYNELFNYREINGIFVNNSLRSDVGILMLDKFQEQTSLFAITQSVTKL